MLQSIFHVAFLRGLFPDTYFKGTSMDNLEGELHNLSCMQYDPCNMNENDTGLYDIVMQEFE